MYFPEKRDVVGETIEIGMVVPSGKLGLRGIGHAVLVVIDPDLGVEVRSPSSGRVIARGGVNLGTVSWVGYFDPDEKDRELCMTALEMIEARVEATVKLFVRAWLSGKWLTHIGRMQSGGR